MDDIMPFKHFIILLTVFFSVSLSYGQFEEEDSFLDDNVLFDIDPRMTLSDSVVAYARQFLGIGYGYNKEYNTQFDCSGFVGFVYGKYGISLPRGSENQIQLCEPIPLDEVLPGDLLFFNGRRVSSYDVGHVSLVTDVTEEGIKMIHATNGGGIMYNTLDVNGSDYYAKRFLTAGRIKDEFISTSVFNTPSSN